MNRINNELDLLDFSIEDSERIIAGAIDDKAIESYVGRNIKAKAKIENILRLLPVTYDEAYRAVLYLVTLDELQVSRDNIDKKLSELESRTSSYNYANLLVTPIEGIADAALEEDKDKIEEEINRELFPDSPEAVEEDDIHTGYDVDAGGRLIVKLLERKMSIQDQLSKLENTNKEFTRGISIAKSNILKKDISACKAELESAIQELEKVLGVGYEEAKRVAAMLALIEDLKIARKEVSRKMRKVRKLIKEDKSAYDFVKRLKDRRDLIESETLEAQIMGVLNTL